MTTGARAILMALLAALAFGSAAIAADTGAATVLSIKGSATLKMHTADEGQPLEAGAALSKGALVETAEGTTLVIEVPGGSKITTGPAATFLRWNGNRLNAASLAVFKGRTLHTVSPLKKQASYQVTTPSATAGVRGTEFWIEVGENGAARLTVQDGEVELGEDEPSAAVSAGGIREKSLLPLVKGTGNWLDRQKVSDAIQAAALERAAAKKMQEINKSSNRDFVELAAISQDVFRFTARRANDLGDAGAALDLVIRGIRLVRLMEARRSRMEGLSLMTNRLAEDFAIDDAASDTAAREYLSRRSDNDAGIDALIAGLEKLSVMVSIAQGIDRHPLGIIKKLPWR